MTDYQLDEGYEDGYDEDGYDYYSEEELAQPDEGEPRVPVEGRTSWIYLGVLLGLFILLVFFSWACNDRGETAGEPQTEDSSEVTAGTAVRLAIVVDGDIATLSGAVPDQAARDQIVLITQNQYGPENVIDDLMVDENTSLDEGVVSVTGSALFDDGRPQQLQEAISAGLGLAQGDLAIDRGEGVVIPVALSGEVAGDTIVFSGGVPDDASVADLIAAGEAIWGAGNVDGSGLAITDSTWTDGAIKITGTTQPGDDRLAAFPAEVQSRFGTLVTIDSSEVTIDQSVEALGDLEEQIKTALAAQPITFAPLSADIDAVSDPVLIEIADILQLVPTASVEVVGHTDSAGNDADNLVLSQDRAAAVITRLVELGVDEARLNARGEGEAIPIGSNDTAEGREQNRRIEFVLVSE